MWLCRFRGSGLAAISSGTGLTNPYNSVTIFIYVRSAHLREQVRSVFEHILRAIAITLLCAVDQSELCGNACDPSPDTIARLGWCVIAEVARPYRYDYGQ
jgi:hypothetical protein